jgi:Fe-S-cluster-containing hydrogenase component 2
MAKFDEHPTVRRVRERQGDAVAASSPSAVEGAWLRQLCLAAGADDVGFVAIADATLADQAPEMVALFPPVKSLVSFVCRMNRENVRSPARSLANLEFHHAGEQINEVARNIVRQLEDHGIRAVNPAMGFPMEAERFPNQKPWVISHKPIAVAAGLGQMGIHRNVIHPRFGNFILLGTILLDAEISEYTQPIDYNLCVECKLCVAACPVGAIGANGSFNFSACYTHNYREFLGGFNDWAESVATSRDRRDYRKQVTQGESASLWQSLSFGANYKAAYCLAACPAGEDVIGPFLRDRKTFVRQTVQPLQDKTETVYVIPGSDAEAHVAKRFPHKQAKRVRNNLVPTSVSGFLFGLALVFQPNQAKGLNAVYHFTFTGQEPYQATVIVREQTCEVHPELIGTPDLQVIADSQTWIQFLLKDYALIWALLRRKVRLKGDPRLLLKFAKCFPT